MPGKTKRENKNKRIPNYLSEEEEESNAQAGGLGKNILLLVEGETELDYFEQLKQNSWCRNNMAGVVVEIGENLGKMKARAKEEKKKQNYQQVWIVSDNDKRNAFILEERESPFFLLNEAIPQDLKNLLQQAYTPDQHTYFLSVYDYLQWLNTAIGPLNIVEFWDRLQHFTEKKRELESFEKEFPLQQEKYVRLAYSCIAFEYWLILHFQQICRSFLWVDKGKNENIDVCAYLRTIPPCRNYEKGTGEGKVCTASKCLYDTSTDFPTQDEDWVVLYRIIMACKNATWLRIQMQPILDRQAGKWYEVNPYILGIDDLIFTLLNIHHQGNPIHFFGLTLGFKFFLEQKILRLQISVDDGEAFGIDKSQSSCFTIKSANHTFLPSYVPTVEFPNNLEWVSILFDQLPDQTSDLVLVFRDPRERSKSHPLLIFLEYKKI